MVNPSLKVSYSPSVRALGLGLRQRLGLGLGQRLGQELGLYLP